MAAPCELLNKIQPNPRTKKLGRMSAHLGKDNACQINSFSLINNLLEVEGKERAALRLDESAKAAQCLT